MYNASTLSERRERMQARAEAVAVVQERLKPRIRRLLWLALPRPCRLHIMSFLEPRQLLQWCVAAALAVRCRGACRPLPLRLTRCDGAAQ